MEPEPEPEPEPEVVWQSWGSQEPEPELVDGTVLVVEPEPQPADDSAPAEPPRQLSTVLETERVLKDETVLGRGTHGRVHRATLMVDGVSTPPNESLCLCHPPLHSSAKGHFIHWTRYSTMLRSSCLHQVSRST